MMSTQQATGNRVLDSLSHEERLHVTKHAERVELKRHEVLIEPNRPMPYVWFPVTALGSLVTVLSDGSSVECGAVGREGMIGVPHLLGSSTISLQTVTQVGGTSLRIPAQRFVSILDATPNLRRRLERYVLALLVVASQSAACNRRHHVTERLARWLLSCSDGIGSNDVAITQDYLAVMLGVRRAGVNESAGELEERGLIRYGRGRVEIIDRPRLEETACECYVAVREEYERVFAD